MKTAVVLFLLSLLGFAAGKAQTPVFDPIRLAEDTDVAQVLWNISLAYHPQGSSGAGFDEFGQYYTFVRFISHWQSAVSVSLSFNSRHKLGMAVGRSMTSSYERRLFAYSESVQESKASAFSYSSYYEHRIAPSSGFDPRLRFSCRFPSAIGVAVSVSRIADPVVLTGMFGLVHQHARPVNWVDISLGAGLVANSRMTLEASSGLTIPVEDAGLPSSSVGLCARYSFEAGGNTEVAVRITLHMQGQSSWIAPALSIRGRTP